MEDEERVCTLCGTVLDEHEGTELGASLLCDDCRDEHTCTCDHCGDRIWNDDTVSDGRTTLCQECFEDHYYRCECCNRIIHDDEVNWRNDTPYCGNCYDFSDEIEEYSYKPDPIFHGTGSRYFGVELEVDCGGKDDDNALTLKELANSSTENIYIKSDGSLTDGFEIVSHPMTLDYHLNEMDWASVLKKASSMGFCSHQTNTCGLHVHVNRNAFGDNQQQQESAISRILFFVEKHWSELFKFSRRRKYNMDRWSARYGYEKTGKEILDKAKENDNRYVAVNLRNYTTIEFRLFRGTLKYNTFIATLQMVNAICEVALSMSEEEIDEMSWSDFVCSITEDELIQYLKERRLYVNELVTVGGGEE